jgi:hypothetical protein
MDGRRGGQSQPRKLVVVGLLIPDDFAIDVLDPVESRDLWRAQSATDRLTSNAYDLVIEGESYRPRHSDRSAHALSEWTSQGGKVLSTPSLPSENRQDRRGGEGGDIFEGDWLTALDDFRNWLIQAA